MIHAHIHSVSSTHVLPFFFLSPICSPFFSPNFYPFSSPISPLFFPTFSPMLFPISPPARWWFLDFSNKFRLLLPPPSFNIALLPTEFEPFPIKKSGVIFPFNFILMTMWWWWWWWWRWWGGWGGGGGGRAWGWGWGWSWGGLRQVQWR